MKKKTLMICSILIVGIVLVSFFINRNLQKQLQELEYKVESANRYPNDFISSCQWHIVLLKRFKSDTLEARAKIGLYTQINEDGVYSSAGRDLFGLVCDLNINSKNKHELRKIKDDFDLLHHRINQFYILHGNINELEKVEIDTLISDINDLIGLMEEMQMLLQ